MAGADEIQRWMTPMENVMPGVTLGTVVDTADPQQMGRVRAMCRSLGDLPSTELVDLPWAEYASPFAGDVQVGTRGPNDDEVTGPTTYGMWAIPKVGAQVLIMCIDGNPQHRVWIGCLFPQFSPHTMPHGRYSYRDEALVEGEQKPAGPFDTYESAINPLYQNLQTAFPEPPTGNLNFEFASRGADFQVAGVRNTQLPNSLSEFADDVAGSDGQLVTTGFPAPFDSVRQGYQISQIDPTDIVIEDSNVQEGEREATTVPNIDNMVTALVSAGFHAVSMDDRAENSRMRFRTAAGHQVILDDTNERIYVSTAKGNNWIEIDQEGNIDIYTSGKLSATADKDVNFKTQGSFRVDAERGIHLNSGKEVRVTAQEDVSIDTQENIRAQARQNILLETKTTDVSIKAAQRFAVQSVNSDISLRSGANLLTFATSTSSHAAGSSYIVGSNTVDFGAAGQVTVSGSTIELNGPQARNPLDTVRATPAEPALAFSPNRTPQHEPWARVDNDDAGAPQLNYDDPQVGLLRFSTGDNGESTEQESIDRGPLWRR